MIKKITAVLLIILTLFLFVGCAQQPETQPTPADTETPQEQAPEDTPVEEVETGISDIDDIEDDLDTSELDDLDEVLSDIENI